jgi:uncharacterized protein (TIGR02466 family)
LVEECRKIYSEKNTPVQVSNNGGWQSRPLSEPVGPVTEKLIAEIKSRLKVIYEKLGNSRTPKLSNYWFNVNNRNNYNISHNHTLAFFSCIYYIKCPVNCGDLILERQDDSEFFLQFFEQENKYNAQALMLEPEESKLVIFPSWVRHGVGQNLTTDKNDARISIAFNFI